MSKTPTDQIVETLTQRMKREMDNIESVANTLMTATNGFEGMPTPLVVAGVTHFYAFLLATLTKDPDHWISSLADTVRKIESDMARMAEDEAGVN
jgi:hypothetical protein